MVDDLPMTNSVFLVVGGTAAYWIEIRSRTERVTNRRMRGKQRIDVEEASYVSISKPIKGSKAVENGSTLTALR